MAPVEVFVDVFAQQGVEVSIDEARKPMGLAKKSHIEALLADKSIAARWKAKFGKEPSSSDADFLYEKLEPQLAKTVVNHNDIIPGTLELLQWCHVNSVKFGSTTGYVDSMMANIVDAVAAKGFTPDCIVASDAVPAGRPAPFMVYENMRRMNVWPASKMVKLGDTVADIGEGINAGMWTIGFTLSGNEAGLTCEEYLSLNDIDKDAIRTRVATKLKAAGAHYVCDGIWDVIPILEEIDKKI
jgi:phosphonoacetaldehyde hydrolase